MLLEFLRKASREKYVFYLCVLLNHDILNEEASKSGIENTSLNMRGYWDLAAWWKLYCFAKNKRIDLIRTYGLKAHIIGRIVGKWLNIPVNITSVRNTDPWRKWYHTLLDRLTSGWTDLYISNSEAGRVATHRRERIPLSKIITIPNGIDLSDYEPYNTNAHQINVEYRQQFDIAPHAPILGTIANLREQKGHKTIVDAFLLIQEKISDVKCLFVGDDLLGGEIHRYIQDRQLEHAFILTGLRQDIPQLLTMFDAFILPSLWEGIPRAILEAMAMKKPVVTTAVGGIPEVVEPGRTGVFIPPNDPQILADTLVSLLNDPKRLSDMGQAGYERIQQFFSLDAVVASTENVYDCLMGGRPFRGE